MKKQLCVVLLLALLLTGCAEAPAEIQPPEQTGSLQVQYLKGGALVQCNGENLLVDCGMDPESLKNYGAERLSAIVLTDASQNPAAMLEVFPAPVYAPGAVEGAQAIVPEDGESLWLDCAQVRFWNREDLALLVSFGDDQLLFLGDMGDEAQKSLGESWQGEAVEALHVHEDTVPGEALLAAVQPRYLLVDGKAEETLKERCETFDTQGFGAVTLDSEGSGVKLSWSFLITDSVVSKTIAGQEK